MKIAAVLLVALLPAFGQTVPLTTTPTGAVGDYSPITGKQRVQWFVKSTVGPTGLLLAGPISAGFGTAVNRPKEYGPHWGGFADRYGMRLTGISTGNAMEAALGTLWGEDPRYFRAQGQPFGSRVEHVIFTTFLAPRADGRYAPAYARFAADIGNNFLSNSWRERSESGTGDAALRCVWGITGRMASQAFAEFWPDVRKLVFKH